MSAENETSGSGVRPLMPHEMRELDEQRNQEAGRDFGEEERLPDCANRPKKAKKLPNTSAQPIARAVRNSIVDAYGDLICKPVPGDKQKRTYAELIAFRTVTAVRQR